ncbi:AMP-binding enzyme [Hirsutella rhossiliensis]|uniref:AMP-binding enzyme domain-containing protein n=1 Tax=Hirsutella rhossiliensis TaxID=111463 RepID=A0A9P8ML67_9HYPO|nr:AMP-binding enzyme domain-containing protein [Hirsutella rhossiliensis]KAH0957075.1 AMP-binding enzyme domain-containing protein [Hirsutella rhossiliensis]
MTGGVDVPGTATVNSATEPARPASEQPITSRPLSNKDLEQIWTWNEAVPPRITSCMHDLFRDKARQRPDAVAVESWDGTLTYGLLDELSSRLARLLRPRGVEIGTRVVLCFEKSMWTIVSLLGVMKAGATFCLTDPSQPEARLRAIVEQMGARLVVASVLQSQLAARICAEAQVVAVSRDYLNQSHDETPEGLPRVPGTSPMYVIFTSGSTGKPKGVVICHENYTSGAIPRAKAVGYTQSSRVFDFPSYAFDVSIDCMLCTLVTGGTVCIPSEADRINDLSGAIRRSRANIVQLTPSVARVLEPDIISSLDVLGVGGEAVSASDATAWGKTTTVVIGYGPSECTIACTINNAVGASTGIGTGVGATTWITDPDNDGILMPVGEVGELLVEGPVVGAGYLGEPEKTAEVFIESPTWLRRGHGSVPGRRGRLYKTGDLVRYEAKGSGSMEFVGRKDHQVKLRGQRVELAEVEHHLRTCVPAGTEVIAEVVEGAGGSKTLTAFLSEPSGPAVADTGTLLTEPSPALASALAGIDTAMEARVPRYMVPAAFVIIRTMPSLVSGKADRKRLRELGASLRPGAGAGHGDDQEPGAETDKEKKLQRAWEQVLAPGVKIDKKSNFLALGGDSLGAMRLVAAARGESLGLSVAAIFANPSLDKMAAEAADMADAFQDPVPPFSLLESDWDASNAKTQTARLCNVAPDAVDDVYPCTPLQEALMALSAKVQQAYVAQRVVELEDAAAAERLFASLDTASRDCPILRTRIVQVPGRGLVQVVVRGGLVRRGSSDLADYLVSDSEESMLLGEPLVRCAVISSTTNKVHFVLTMHHALYDGWAIPLIMDRVNKVYRGQTLQRPAEFKHFIRYLGSVAREDTAAYWREQLDGATVPQFPALPFDEYQAQADSLLEVYVPLRPAAASEATMATVIRAAWALVVSQYGNQDVVFGETLTGRNASVVGAEQIEGPMITTVPVRIRIHGHVTVAEYLASVQEQAVSQIPHEHFGLQHIRKLSLGAFNACQLRTGLVIHPSTGQEELQDDHLLANKLAPAGDAEAAQEALRFNPYALMLVCFIDAEGVRVMASFDSRTVASPVMQGVLDHLKRVAQMLCDEESGSLAHVLDLTSDDYPLEYSHFQHAKYGSGARSVATHATNHGRSIEDQDAARPELVTSRRQIALRRLWSNVLVIEEDDIGLQDDFFLLGGDSISAMKLASEARLEGFKLTVMQAFQNRSLYDMARTMGDETAAPPQEPGRNKPFSLLRVQDCRRVWVPNVIQPQLADSSWTVADVLPARPLQQLAVNGTTQVPRYAVRYELMHSDVGLDRARLTRACDDLFARNEILRTVFIQHDGQCLGVVIQDLPVSFVHHVIDGDVQQFSKQLCQLDVLTSMPLGSSFVKWFLIESTKGPCCLILRLSHAQYDEMCLPFLLRQLSALHENKPVPASVPFSSYVGHVLQESLPASVSYWRDLLAGSSMTVLKPDIPVLKSNHFAIRRTVDISSRPRHVTIATLPTAAWALCLARRLCLRDVVFGEVVSGRNIGFPNADAVMGPCWQYIPVRVRFDAGWTVLDLLEHIQHQHVASSAHEGVAIGEITAQCTDWDPATTSNWFDSVVHQDVAHVEGLSFAGADVRTETVYPHEEPLREWKIQAFIEGHDMTLEIITVESWGEYARGLLDDLVNVATFLVEEHRGLVC